MSGTLESVTITCKDVKGVTWMGDIPYSGTAKIKTNKDKSTYQSWSVKGQVKQ